MASLDVLWNTMTRGVVDDIQHSVVFAAFATLLVVILTTRALSGGSAVSGKNGIQKTPSKPSHWLPFIGNAPWMAIDRDGYLARMRDLYPDGIFSLVMLGKTHHFIHKPSLSTALFNIQKPAAEEKIFTNHLLEFTFGLRKEDRALYSQMTPDAHAQYEHLLTESGRREITSTVLRHVKQHIFDFVTFNGYPADQMEWERLADTDVIENANARGDTFVEANLMELARNFIAKMASLAIFGTDFVENFPEVWKWIWMFDEAFVLMAANAPAWVPSPRLQRGKLARRRILDYTYEFNEALEKHLNGEEPGQKWQDLDNVSGFVKERAEQFRKHGMSPQGRGVFDFALLWSLAANMNQLISWMLVELYRDPVLLEQVREEIAPYITAVQPKNDFGPAVWVPAELEEVDIDGLVSKCPLLKAAYVETMRVYTGGWETKWMEDDTVLAEGGKGNESYLLEKGSWAHIPHDMHHSDPKYFPNPTEWQAERHIKEVADENGRKTRVADLGTVRPFGDSVKMCKGRHFALREMLLYTAVIITFYDMQPPKGGSWDMPKTVRFAATKRPKKPIRVWIKRREPPQEGDAGQT